MTRHKKTRQVLARLARIEGHVRAVKRMVERGRSCAEVLLQMAAVRAALDRAAKVLLADHMEHCLHDLAGDARARRHLAGLRQAMQRFIR